MWVDLRTLGANTPGQASLVLKQWTGAGDDVDIAIQRNQDMGYLQTSGLWSSTPHWFPVASLEQQGDDWAAVVGKDIVDPLLQTVNAVYRPLLRLRGGNETQQGAVLKVARELMPSAAAGKTASATTTGELPPPAAAEPVAPVELPEPAPEAAAEPAAPTPQPPAPPRKRSAAPAIGIAVALLAAIGAGLWFWKFNTPAPEAVAPTAAPADATVCGAGNMGNKTELEFVQACVKENLASPAMLEVIQTAKKDGHCGIAQRLYANKAQAGDVQIALAYAKEYDPKYLEPSKCFATPDKATAAYWYETVLGVDANNAEAKERFEELSK
ncbi:MAG: hypothetical protein ACN6PR_02375 [Achromobacter sp.]